MRIYSAYLDPASLEQDRALTMVKEGMCWPAFFFSFLWAAWHRLWWAALGLLAAALGVPAILNAAGAGGATGLLCVLAIAAFVGAAANDWRGRALERRGRRLVAVIAGRNGEDAARRFFERAPGDISVRTSGSEDRAVA